VKYKYRHILKIERQCVLKLECGHTAIINSPYINKYGLSDKDYMKYHRARCYQCKAISGNFGGPLEALEGKE